MSGQLKRKFAEVDQDPEDPCSPSSISSPTSSSISSPTSSSISSPTSSPTSCSEWESDGEGSPSEYQDFTPSFPTSPVTTLPIRPILKKKCRESRRVSGASVRFDQVTVFLFPRCQSFSSVPSRGGATLGMVARHSALRSFTLAEHALDSQRRRRERFRERLRQERLEALRNNLSANGVVDLGEAARLMVDAVPDEDLEVHGGEAELQDGGLLPYSSKQRKALLRAAGVKRIDREEKRQLQALRLSRDDCGCDCQGFCEPETCACSLAGIKCQMDRSSFPCGCSQDCCGNPNGRVEFNSRRVQTHYLHTVMRIELERRLQDDTLNQPARRAVPEERTEIQENQDLHQQDVQEKSCPFGFDGDEDGLHLTIPTTPTFHFIPELAMVGDSSYSSDTTTDSSCSSAHSDDSDPGVSPQQRHPEEDGGLARLLNLCDWESEDTCSDGETRRSGQRLYQPLGSSGTCTYTDNHLGSPQATDDHPSSPLATDNHLGSPLATDNHPGSPLAMDNHHGSSLAGYLDENANQATAFFADSSLQEYPNTPSPSGDYSSYMDLSLSSDSDLEFFDSFPDSGSGPLHNSFKGHTHPDNFHHLQLLSRSNLPEYDHEHSACLLESLIGCSEATSEPPPSFTDNQLLEMVQ